MMSPGSVAGPSREEGANLRPGDLWLAAVAGENSSCVGHFPSEVRIAGWRQIIEDPQRLVPPTVEGKAAEPGQPRRDARTKGAAGATQRRLRLGCEPTPGGGLGRAIRQRHVAHLPEERECHQGVVVILREEFTGPRPRPVRRVGSTHGRVNDAQPVVGERGASGQSSPRPRFVDERDELFVRVNRRAQVSGSGQVPAVGALPKVEPGGMEPLDRAFVLNRVDRGRRWEEDVEPRLDRGRHLCSL